MSIYEITGESYRGHERGQRVEMVLDRMAEARAFRRRQIVLLERSTPCLVEGSYRLPVKAADAAGRGTDVSHQDPDQGRRPDSA